MSDRNPRGALLAELGKSDIDSGKILELAAELASTDPDRVRFTADAGLVARLGRELVAKHDTALSELVKNAYDADATIVTVEIAPGLAGDFLEITDDGTGMAHEDLVQGFMRLATPEKLANPFSKVFKRRRAGRKGVGRLAAERLGHTLILTTTTEADEFARQTVIDWHRFKPGVELSSVSFKIDHVTKHTAHGTTMRIEGLRDNWTTPAIERTFEHVAELIDPASRGDANSSSFEVSFLRVGAKEDVVDLRSQVETQAFATISAKIDFEGRVTWSLECPSLQISIVDRALIGDSGKVVALLSARNATLSTKYYILDSSLFAPTAFRTVRKYLNSNGGIRIYRNGFRVAPYGQQGNDWLSLDLLSARRTGTLAPIRNRNFLGYVSLADDVGLFEETSSREGLLENAAFDELTEALHSVLVTAVREIDAERTRRDLKRDRAQPTDSDYQSVQEAVSDLATAIAEAQASIDPQQPQASTIAASLQKASSIAQVIVQKARVSDALLREMDLLRVLASMGLAIGQFTHEFSTLSGAMRANLSVLMEKDRSEAEHLAAASSMRTLLDQARSFTGLFKTMTEGNALRQREPLDLYEATTWFASAISSILRRNAVVMEIQDTGDELLTPPMHRSELFAVLLNLTTNSIKAIKRRGDQGKILIELGAGIGATEIRFSDNGDGIAEEVSETLFEPFVTTTAAKGVFGDDDDLAVGSGLGLTIVRDIVGAAGGTASVSEPTPPFATTITISLPRGRTN